MPPQQATDHYIIEFQIQQTFRRADAVSRNVFEYKQGKFDELRIFLTQNPPVGFSSENINGCWLQWKEWFFNAVHKFIPVKTVKDVNSPPWIDGEVRYFIRKKYSALNKYRKRRTDHRKQKLREPSQAVKNLVKRKHRDYLLKIQDSFRDNPKLFWSYHKPVFHHRLAKTPSEKAELSNSYFSFVFQLSRTKQHQASNFYMIQSRSDSQLRAIELSEQEVANCLRNLDVSKANGPDGIPARLLKECSNEIGPTHIALAYCR